MMINMAARSLWSWRLKLPWFVDKKCQGNEYIQKISSNFPDRSNLLNYSVWRYPLAYIWRACIETCDCVATGTNPFLPSPFRNREGQRLWMPLWSAVIKHMKEPNRTLVARPKIFDSHQTPLTISPSSILTMHLPQCLVGLVMQSSCSCRASCPPLEPLGINHADIIERSRTLSMAFIHILSLHFHWNLTKLLIANKR